MKRITKDAATVLHTLYSQFWARRKTGQSKQTASFFGSAESIHDDLCNSMCIEDVEDAMCELDRVGYLVNDYGDDTIVQCFLTSVAIADCENAFSDKICSLVDFISKFR